MVERDDFLALADRLQRLLGSAGTFGYAALSQVAQGFERFLRSAGDTACGSPSPQLTAQMESFLSWLDMAQRLMDEERLSMVEIVDDSAFMLPTAEDMAQRRAQAAVYLLKADTAFSRDFCLGMELRGYRVRHFDRTDAFAAAVAEQPPDVAIMDVALGGGREGLELAADLRRSGQLTAPIVFLTVRSDFQSRLEAARVGSAHYFVKPVDIEQVAHALDGLISCHGDEPCRVALLQDGDAAANPYRRWLEAAGMSVTVLENPESVVRLLDAAPPELLLIDLQRSDCSGAEVAAVVRQFDGCADIPILLLSGDGQTPSAAGLYQGGDEYLGGPVSEARLLESVKARVRRYRDLQWAARQARLAVNDLQNFKLALDQHAIVSITDRQGTILYANNKFCQISGYTHQELIGQNHRIVKGDMPAEVYADLWRTIAAGREWRGELRNKSKDGRYYWVESSVMPLGRDAHGVPERYIAIRTEVTALKQVQEALAESDERLRRSQYYANVGTWDWDIATDHVICSERVGALFGGPEGVSNLSYEDFLDAVHPDDRDQVAAAMAACLDSGLALDLEHRVLWPDASIHWLNHRGDVTRTLEGRPLHLLGVVTDVTWRKQAEETLLKQKELLEVLRQAVLRYIGEEDTHDIAVYLLRALVDLTDSQYGLLGEVKYDAGGSPYLLTQAMSSNAGEQASRAMNQGRSGQGVEIHNLHSLLGSVLTSGKPVLSNNVAADPRGSGMLPQQLVVSTFLGVPVYYGGRMVAMYGIANRAQGYDDALLEFLRPFDATVAVVADAMRRADETRALQAQVLQARDEAERASSAKTEFLSRMSHELRTPLNAVLGFAQLLENDPDEPLSNCQKDSVDQILVAGWHLLKLINEVLDLSRIESGKVSLEVGDMEVEPLLDECLALLSPVAAQRKIRINLERASVQGCWLRGDEMRFKQVLLNLLSNAIKYNREGGDVRVGCSPVGGDYVRISVSDTGEGLTEEKQAHLFEAFNRMGAEHSGVEGTGIGLVIVKRLVEMMGGEIGVHSEVGQGSEFWVTLPRGQAAAGQASVAIAPSAEERVAVIRYKVLYVEDNVANLRMVERLLARYAQYEMMSAPDAELGVELARSHRPDLILMDINLPGMDGYAALRWLRAHKETSAIPVVALSANAMQNDIQRGLSAGFDAYLAKPVSMNELLDTLERFTAR